MSTNSNDIVAIREELHRVIQQNNILQLEHLVETYPPWQYPIWNMHLLRHICIIGHILPLRYLLANQIIKHPFSDKKQTSIYWACKFEHFEIVEYLLSICPSEKIPECTKVVLEMILATRSETLLNLLVTQRCFCIDYQLEEHLEILQGISKVKLRKVLVDGEEPLVMTFLMRNDALA